MKRTDPIKRLSGFAIAMALGLGLMACGIPIETATDAPCAGTDMGIFRLVAASGTLGLQLETGETSRAVWPAGFSAEQRLEGFVLLDRERSVVAQEGETVHIGGGEDQDGVIVVCSVVLERAP